MIFNKEKSGQSNENSGSDDDLDLYDLDDDDDDEGGEGWLASYSDLITDLMAVFVILYAFAAITTSHENKNLKNENETIMSESESIKNEILEVVEKLYEISENAEINGTATSDVVDQIQNELDQLGALAGLDNSNSSDDEAKLDEMREQFDAVYELIKKRINDGGYSDMINLEKGEGYFTFKFKDNLLFYPDSPIMRENSFEILDYIGDLLLSVERLIEAIEISGYTADIGLDIDFFSWELSANRAITVLKFLSTESDFPQSKMSIAGYSHYKPIAENDTEANRALNRRVEMKVYRIRSLNTRNTTNTN